MTWAPPAGRRRTVAFVLVVLVFSLALGGCASVEQQLRRAAQLEQRGDHAAALDAYQDAITRIDANDRTRLAETYVRVGECLWRLERPNDSLNAFERALQLDPMNANAHLRIAEIYITQAPGRALGGARFVLSLQPNNVEALAVMGAAFASAGEMTQAKQAYHRVLELEPTRVSVAIALADAEYREPNVAEARAVLLHATAAAPRSALPWLTLGRLEEQEGDATAAEEAYRHAVAAEDTAETNLRMAQFLQRNARIGEAEQILRRADSLQPWLPTALPDFEFQSGRVANAMQAYSSALRPGQLPAAPGAVASAGHAERGGLAARMIEADLALATPDAAQLARQHLDE